ncbi:MAG: hypothetical protein HF973_08385 [Chloroflexi bacterium]|nr:hypothetical protein [Chloroflexota bacterium]
MSWLPVPHLQQDKPAWCLPACIAMVAAYWEQPLYQADVAQWLGTTLIGTPSSRIQKIAQYGFDVVYQTGSLAQLTGWLGQKVPCILFVRTGELPYWQVDTPHAVVLAGVLAESAFLFDPAFSEAPAEVGTDALMLAWSYSDYTYAVILPQA